MEKHEKDQFNKGFSIIFENLIHNSNPKMWDLILNKWKRNRNIGIN
jgi:hypothetical protein